MANMMNLNLCGYRTATCVPCRGTSSKSVSWSPYERTPTRGCFQTHAKRSKGQDVQPAAPATPVQAAAPAKSFGLPERKKRTTKSDDIDKEIQFQESEVDLTIEDLTQLQYEVVEDDEDEDEDEGGDADGRTLADFVNAEPEISIPENRRITILMELLSAGGSLDAKISQFRDNIDIEMLQLLAQRLETARSYEQNSPAVQRLEDLYRTLKVVYQRSEASPAMRLLDDVLDILGDSSSPRDEDPFAVDASGAVDLSDMTLAGAYVQRRNEAASRMKSAFTGGMADGVDIFAAAAALAEAGPLAAEELSVEYVRLHEFLAETSELLDQAKQQQQELAEAITRTERELDYVSKKQPGILTTDLNLKDRARQLKLARVAYEDREQSMAQLDDVVYIARSFEVQNMRDQGGGALEF